MTYANLDEAFGNSFNRCEEPPKKKEKFNCNKNKSTFTVNEKDREIDSRNINLPNEPAPQSDNLNNNIDFTNFATFSNKPKNNNLLEPFENPPSQQNQNQNPNEIFEYSEEENNFIENVATTNPVEGEVEVEEEKQEPKPKPKKRKRNKNEEINNSQIVEINNKMNFIIDQLNNNASNSDTNNESNIHDVVLFILFGVFVIVILESLYKLVVKLCRYKMFNQ